jgi:SAM-dependent methyltransferase
LNIKSKLPRNAYAELAAEYYDPLHKTCRNFDAATVAALARHSVILPSHGLTLEVGCGRGRSQEFLRITGSRVVQLDSSPEMLAVSPREESLLRVLADATNVPLLDSQFSAVVGFLVDSFIGLCFFAEAYRLLLPRGVLLLTTPAAEWGHALRGSQEPDVSSARFVNRAGEIVTVPSTLIASNKIAEMLSHCGFESISIYPVPLPADVHSISPDVAAAASRAGKSLRALPLIYLIAASKPAD